MAFVVTGYKQWHRVSAKRLAYVVLLCLLLLLLSSCRFVAQTQVQPDGSGLFREAQVFEQEKDWEPEKTCKLALWSSDPTGAVYSLEEHGEQVYCIRTRHFRNLQELRQFYTSWDQVDDAYVTVHKLDLDRGQFVFDVTVDLTKRQDASAIYEIQLIPPGTLGKHNAPQVNGRKLIWTLKPGQKVTLLAESTVGSSPLTDTSSQPVGSTEHPTPLLLLAGGGVACVIGGGIMLFLRRRRRSRKLEQQVACETQAQRQYCADREKHEAYINQQLADLFQNRYSQAATDLDAIVEQLQKTPGLSKAQKEALLEQIGEEYLKNLDQRTTTAYERLLAQLLGTSRQDATDNKRRSDISG